MVQAGRATYIFTVIFLLMALTACGAAPSNGSKFTQQTTTTTASPTQSGGAGPGSLPPSQEPPPGFSCPQGTEDIVSWMMPSDMAMHMEGNHDYKAFYLRPGKMYFTKNRRGWPLDEKLYDDNFIYDYITENGNAGWADPSNVKEFVIPVKLAPRCIPVGSPGQKLASVGNSRTPFVAKMSCNIVQRTQLGHVLGEVWNVGAHDFGLLDLQGREIGPVDTRVLTYNWSCDSNYQNCRVREELWLARGYGWVEWKNYVLQNGQYVLKNDTKGTHAAQGMPTPVQPCGDAPIQ